MERDCTASNLTPASCAISTHTLTWSVTTSRVAVMSSSPFQLTRSRGAWLWHLKLDCRTYHFNSHAHVERDWNVNEPRATWEISTHTLTWSVTVSWQAQVFQNLISTHTLTWSVTSASDVDSYCTVISTHTLTWSVTERRAESDNFFQFQLTRSRGAWPAQIICFPALTTFQLTRSRGAWRHNIINPFSLNDFNSHAHVERDPFYTYILPQ